MPSSNDNFPPEAFDVCLAVTMRRTLAIAGAIILTLDLQTHTRLPEGRYLVLVLYVTYGVLLYMAVRWRRFILPGGVEPWLDVGSALLFPSAGATLSFAYPEFEVRPAFVELTAFVCVAPQARVVVLTDIRDPETYRRAVHLGARGLVAKNKPTEALLQAIAKAHAGKIWTVHQHLTSIFAKLEVTDRLELVLYAYRLSLTRLRPKDL